MRLKLLLIGLGAAFILATGFIPGTLPFNPGADFSDAATSHWTAALFLRESLLEAHQFPIWRETTMAGAPFAANPLNKTAYPLQWLLLILSPALHLDVMIMMHLLIAGAGMWRWTRTLKLRPEAAALSALAYALAPRVIGHTGAGHLDLLYALAWFPWLMNGVYRLVKMPSPPTPLPQGEGSSQKNTQTPSTVLNVIEVSLFASLVFLADTRLSLFAFATAAAYGLFEAAQARRAERLMLALPIVMPGFLLTASVTLPLLGWSPYLSRAGLMAAEAGVFSLEPAQLVGLLLPPQGGNIETLTYVGFPILILAGIALVAMPRKLWFWLMILVFAAWYALGINGFLWTALVRIFPPLLWFRVPSRAWFIVALIMPLLAGYGLDWLLTRVGRRSPHRWRLIALAGLAAAFACGVCTLIALPLPDSAGWSILIGGVGFAAIVFATLNGALRIERAALLILIVTCADLLMTGRSWLEWRGDDQWLQPYEALATTLVDDNAARIYSPTYSLSQETAAAYDLHLFGGVDPFQIEGVVQAVAQAGGIELNGYSVVSPPLNDIEGNDLATANRGTLPDTVLLAEWDVSHVVAAYAIDHPRLVLLTTVNDVYVYRNLDYTASETAATLPRWGSGEGLPDAKTVAQLNQLTTAAFAVSAICLLMCVLFFIRVKR